MKFKAIKTGLLIAALLTTPVGIYAQDTADSARHAQSLTISTADGDNVVITKVDKETGKIMQSTDGGKTWTECDDSVFPLGVATAVSTSANGEAGFTNAGELSETDGQPITISTVSIMIKTDEETGKTMQSTDGGKTWTECDDSVPVFSTAAVPSTPAGTGTVLESGWKSGDKPEGQACLAIAASNVMIKVDEETGKLLKSTDGGETWTELEVLDAPPLTEADQQ